MYLIISQWTAVTPAKTTKAHNVKQRISVPFVFKGKKISVMV